MLTYRKFLESKAKAVNAATHQNSVVRLGYEVVYGGLVKYRIEFKTPHQLATELIKLGIDDQKVINAIGMSAIAYVEDIHDWIEYSQNELTRGE